MRHVNLLLAAALGAVARSVTRCYSLSDCPTPAHYRVTIKCVVHLYHGVRNSAEHAYKAVLEDRARTLSWSGKQSNLLDFVEAHGIQVESGCRSGSCGSCVSTVRPKFITREIISFTLPFAALAVATLLLEGLDRDHNVDCVTCHVGNDYSRYTCYGCHAHTVQNILREHRDEGIRDLDNCVLCHRSADGEGGEGGGGDD